MGRVNVNNNVNFPTNCHFFMFTRGIMSSYQNLLVIIGDVHILLTRSKESKMESYPPLLLIVKLFKMEKFPG